MRSALFLALLLCACSGPSESSGDLPSEPQVVTDGADSVRAVDPAPVGPGPPPGTAYADVQIGECRVEGAQVTCGGEVTGNIVRARDVRLLSSMAIQLVYRSDADFSDRIISGELVRLHLGSPPPMMGDAPDLAWRVLGVR